MMSATLWNGMAASCGAAAFARAVHDEPLAKLKAQKGDADQCDQASLGQQETV